MWSYAGTSSNAFGQHTPKHILTHNTVSLVILSLLQLTFPLKDNITQLLASCFWQRQYYDVQIGIITKRHILLTATIFTIAYNPRSGA